MNFDVKAHLHLEPRASWRPLRSTGIQWAFLECDVLPRGGRCWGAATVDVPSQRNQASPLHVKELEKLHSVLENSSDIWDKMFVARFFL